MTIRKGFYVFLVLLLITALCEAGLRLAGYQPLQVESISQLNCSNKLVETEPYLGFGYLPGIHQCNIGGKEFSITIGRDSFRITSDSSNEPSKPLIQVYGCSITWGHGLDDSATLAWKLQEIFPQSRVSNYGVGAGSNIQSLLILKRQIEIGNVPDVVVLNYASFHNMRNAMTWPWRKVWQSILAQSADKENDKKVLAIPYGRIGNDGNLVIRYMPDTKIWNNLPGSGHLATLNLANEAYKKFTDGGVNEVEITRKVIEEMNKLCVERRIKFVLTEIVKDKAGDDMLEYFKTKGVTVADISVDISNNNYNLMPYDKHPNASANAYYAASIAAIIDSIEKMK